jgi:flagellar biosynthesis/type III secretory pathway M-ring protein FliF/YscJ
MTPSLPSLLIALLSFAVTFIAARSLASWFKRRRARQAEQQAEQTQSRQVRRAKARARKRQ